MSIKAGVAKPAFAFQKELANFSFILLIAVTTGELFCLLSLTLSKRFLAILRWRKIPHEILDPCGQRLFLSWLNVINPCHDVASVITKEVLE